MFSLYSLIFSLFPNILCILLYSHCFLHFAHDSYHCRIVLDCSNFNQMSGEESIGKGEKRKKEKEIDIESSTDNLPPIVKIASIWTQVS